MDKKKKDDQEENLSKEDFLKIEESYIKQLRELHRKIDEVNEKLNKNGVDVVLARAETEEEEEQALLEKYFGDSSKFYENFILFREMFSEMVKGEAKAKNVNAQINDLLPEIRQVPGGMEFLTLPYRDYIDQIDENGEPIEGTLLKQVLEKAYRKKYGIRTQKKAEQEYPIVNAGTRLATITDENWQFAITPIKNPTAYITLYRNTLRFKGSGSTPRLDVNDEGKLEDYEKLDLPLLGRFFSAVYKSRVQGTWKGIEVSVYANKFCQEMGVKDINVILNKLEPFSRCVGTLYETEHLVVWSLIGWNSRTGVITFASPYFNRILQEMGGDTRRIVTSKKGKPLKDKEGNQIKTPAFSLLRHSELAKERNKTAVAITEVIEGLLRRRGLTPDSELKKNQDIKALEKETKKNKGKKAMEVEAKADPRCSCHISIQTIIERTPLLQERLDKAGKAKNNPGANQNSILKSSFLKAFELLKTKTDLYQYYKNLHITEFVPTISKATRSIEIWHDGVNPAYKRVDDN